MHTTTMDSRSQTIQGMGWMLFLLCAVLFLISGVRSGDTLITAGSALFLLACFLFLYSLKTKGQ